MARINNDGIYAPDLVFTGLETLIGSDEDGTTRQFELQDLTAFFGTAGNTLSDIAYGVSWDGNLEGASKNALYDKIETLVDLDSTQNINGFKIFRAVQTSVNGVLQVFGSSAQMHIAPTDSPLNSYTTGFGTLFVRQENDALSYNPQASGTLGWSLLSENTFRRDYTLPDKDGTFAMLDDIIGPVPEVYGVGWDGSLEAATKNDLYDIINSITGAAGIAGSIADNQVAFGNGLAISGSSNLQWDDSSLLLNGSGSRYVRFGESPNVWNGAFLEYEGASNRFHIGTHTAGNTDILDDIRRISIIRDSGFIGINKEVPTVEFDVVGRVSSTLDIHTDTEFTSPGVRIAETFTDFTNRVALVNPSFGGSRLGDSALQTPTLDVGTTLNFVAAAQTVQWASFANASGNTLTWRHVQNPTALFSIQNNAASSTRTVTDVESTIGLVTQYSNGDSFVYDLFNQEYIGDSSVLAQAQGVNMIAPVGDHRKYGIYRSEPGLTNVTTLMEIDGVGIDTQIATWSIPVVAPSYALSALNTAPADAIDTGTLGEIRIDANHIYVCVALNEWKRVAIATF